MSRGLELREGHANAVSYSGELGKKAEPRAKSHQCQPGGCCRGSPRIWRSEGSSEEKQNIAESW